MLSPRYLDGLSDEIADIYAQLEADILADMARRLAKLGKITEATKWQAQLLAETGALKKDVNRLIKKYDPAVQKELKAIYNDALIKNARSNNRIFEEALGHGVSDINAQVMLASIQKTHSDLSRLTITTAYTTEQQFVQQANAAYMQVATGAVDYDSAMKSACDNLAKQGITGVHYRNGKPVRLSIEAAVRMNVLTGVNQTASAVTMSNCEELGCDLVETSAHIGARPEHEAWQGEIFSLSGTNPKYRPFSVCGLGTIEGICGINCRHSYYPYFEGMENHYTTSELDEMADQTVTYNGKEMTRYEGEEKLRSMERTIRQYKRRAITQEAAGLDNTAAREKIGEWQAKARDFTKQTGIARDSAREFVGTIDGKQPRGIIPPKPEPTPAPKPTPKATPTPAPKPAPQKITESVEKKTEALVSKLVDTPKSNARIWAENQNITSRPVYAHAKPLTQDEIIKYIAGADKTKGSCSSAASAYIANKAGFDVRDFRGGKSQILFSDRSRIKQFTRFNGVESYTVSHTNDFTAFNQLKAKMKSGKEYELVIGSHAAIVRKLNDGTVEYLELQSAAENKFKSFQEYTLRYRFGAKKSHSSYGRKYEIESYLFDIETLGKSREFYELMQYINTAENEQLIGAGGFAK